MSSFERFKTELISKSVSNNYFEALDEWEWLYTVSNEDECLCGKTIFNLNYMENRHKGTEIIVGSVCVNKFMKENKRLMNNYKVFKYNENAQDKNTLKRRCISCSKLFKINDPDQHCWKLKCTRCHIDHVKKIKATKPKKLIKQNLKVYECSKCEMPFVSIEGRNKICPDCPSPEPKINTLTHTSTCGKCDKRYTQSYTYSPFQSCCNDCWNN